MAYLHNKSILLPYQDCLIPNITLEVQLQLRDITNLVLVPLDMLLAFLSLVSNLVVFITVARTTSLQHPSLLLLCSLSVSDLMWAVLCFFRDIKKVMHRHLCPEKMEVETYVAIMCCFATLGNLVVISRDRYRAVSRPWSYRSHVARSRVMKDALVCWLLSFAAVVLVFTILHLRPDDARLGHLIGVIFYIVCIILIIVYYAGIPLAIRRHRMNMPVDAREMAAILKRERKLASTVGLLLLALLFFSIPALLTPVVLSVVGYKSKAPFRPFFTPLITLNGILNPLFNYGRNKDMRRAVRNMLGCQHPHR